MDFADAAKYGGAIALLIGFVIGAVTALDAPKGERVKAFWDVGGKVSLAAGVLVVVGVLQPLGLGSATPDVCKRVAAIQKSFASDETKARELRQEASSAADGELTKQLNDLASAYADGLSNELPPTACIR